MDASTTRFLLFLNLKGVSRHGLVGVTCYSNLGDDALVYVCNETDVTTLLCSGKSIKFLDSLHEQIPKLKYLIYTDELSQESKFYKTISFEECCKLGADKPVPVEKEPKKDDLCVGILNSF